MEQEQKEYLSDILGKEVERWGNNHHIFIEAPTGIGKTTFIIEILRKRAEIIKKPILYLCNRKALYNQFRGQICRELLDINVDDTEECFELDWFVIKTYQTLQKEYIYTEKKEYNYFNLQAYSYIVCDEFHYILADASFNGETVYFMEYLKGISNKLTSPCVIYLSATMEEVDQICLDYIGKNECDLKERSVGKNAVCFEGNNIKKYRVLQKGSNYSLSFIKKLTDIISIIEDTSEDEKFLIFISNIDKYLKEVEPILKEKKMDYQFIQAKDVQNNTEFYKDMIEKEKFSSRILITTKILDVGINLKDEKLKHIVLNTTEKTEFLQMIGRKRGMIGEKIDIYMLNRSAKYFETKKGALRTRLEMYQLSPIKMWMTLNQESDKNISKRMCYVDKNGQVCINRLYKIQIKNQVRFIEKLFDIAKKSKMSVECVFQNQVMDWLQVDDKKEIEVDYKKKQKENENLKTYLMNHYSDKMDKEKQEEFSGVIQDHIQKNKFKQLYKKSRKMGMVRINKFFEEVNLGLTVVSEKSKGKTYWRLQNE